MSRHSGRNALLSGRSAALRAREGTMQGVGFGSPTGPLFASLGFPRPFTKGRFQKAGKARSMWLLLELRDVRGGGEGEASRSK